MQMQRLFELDEGGNLHEALKFPGNLLYEVGRIAELEASVRWQKRVTEERQNFVRKAAIEVDTSAEAEHIWRTRHLRNFMMNLQNGKRINERQRESQSIDCF